jgi:hypothetical protein
MNAAELQQALIDWSVKYSGYEDHRNYIGLSGISDCPKVIFRRFFNSYAIQVKEHLRTRYSHEIEGVIKDRLRKMGVLEIGQEISAYQGMVRGHIDGEISEKLLEIKTVPLAEYLPVGGVPRKVFWQVQGYMCYGGYEEALVLYFARDKGTFRTFEIPIDQAVGNEIDAKIKSVLDAVKRRVLPICVCGRCA